MKFDGFDWDDGNREKCVKHGVSLNEIEQLFSSLLLVAPDTKHSRIEERHIAVGTTTEAGASFSFSHGGTSKRRD